MNIEFAARYRGIELNVRCDRVDTGDKPIPLQVPVRVVQVARMLYKMRDRGCMIDWIESRSRGSCDLA